MGGIRDSVAGIGPREAYDPSWQVLACAGIDMNEAMDCPVCSTLGKLEGHGVVAPWISDLLGTKVPQFTQLRRCPRCGLVYYTKRYGDADMASLYGQYRGTAYMRGRRRWEPWYGERVNAAFEPGTAATEQRVSFLESSLAKAYPQREWRLIVDVGGDAGQFFPRSGAARRVLIDPSEKGLPPGVERAATLADLGDEPDLIVLAHVLEHLPRPLDMLLEMRQYLSSNGCLYVEVPWDLPLARPIHSRPRYRAAIQRVARYRPSFVASDFVAGVLRQYDVGWVPLPVLKQSEHINYFTPQSLVAVLARAGFDCVSLQTDRSAAPAGLRLGLISVVARKADGS